MYCEHANTDPRYMRRVTYVPELLCYPELEALELQNNHIDKVAEQPGLSALASLNLSSNLLRHTSALQSLRFLVSLTELQLTGNAAEQHPGSAFLLPVNLGTPPRLMVNTVWGPVHHGIHTFSYLRDYDKRAMSVSWCRLPEETGCERTLSGCSR